MLFFWGIVLAVAAALPWGLVRLKRIAAIGAAYKAKVLCSLVFVSRRDPDPGVPDVSGESYWPLRFLSTRIDPDEGSVSVSFLGLQPRTAVYRPGFGATLYPDRSLAATHGKANRERGGVAEAARSVRLQADLASPAKAGHYEVAPGSDTGLLGEVVTSAFTEPHPKRRRRTRAIVIVHDGRIVAERYAPGFTDRTPLAGWSVTKSVMGTLIGILVAEGRLSLQDSALLPEWQPPDPRAKITIEDLLRLRSGLAFSEIYSDFNSDVIEMLFNRPDAAAYAASRPLSAPPGSTWRYDSGTTNILSAIARRVVGEDEYPTWPRRVLFDPLGMHSAVMETDASGTFVGSSFMFATARDWAKFGQLQIQEGDWHGRQVVPAEWVRFSASPTLQSPEGVYGAHWWRKLAVELGGTTPAAARIPEDAFFAIGHEGQVLSIVPSRRLVVVRLGLSVHIDAWDQAGFLADVLDALPA